MYLRENGIEQIVKNNVGKTKQEIADMIMDETTSDDLIEWLNDYEGAIDYCDYVIRKSYGYIDMLENAYEEYVKRIIHKFWSNYNRLQDIKNKLITIRDRYIPPTKFGYDAVCNAMIDYIDTHNALPKPEQLVSIVDSADNQECLEWLKEEFDTRVKLLPPEFYSLLRNVLRELVLKDAIHVLNKF